MKKKLILLGIILIGMSSCCSDNKTTINSSSESGDTIFLQKGESFKDIINDGDWSTRYMITEDSTLGIHKVYKLDNLYNKFELKYIIKEEKK